MFIFRRPSLKRAADQCSVERPEPVVVRAALDMRHNAETVAVEHRISHKITAIVKAKGAKMPEVPAIDKSAPDRSQTLSDSLAEGRNRWRLRRVGVCEGAPVKSAIIS